MVSDTTFRTSEEVKPVEEHVVEAKNEASQIDDHVEVPYLDKKDFLDEYFKIGVDWHDQDSTFYPEIKTISTYIKSKIENGEIGNDQTAVKQLLQGMEKMNNLKGETRSVVKLEVLANYIEFLIKNDHLKSNLKRYAN